jgi:hypothetical protein
VLEPLAIGFLQWLRRERRFMFSTTEGYLNRQCVMSNLYFADPTNSSFDQRKSAQAVMAGLRRLRSHAHSHAIKEGKQKPVHPESISWRSCQFARRRPVRAYTQRKKGTEGSELQVLYAELERKRNRVEAEREGFFTTHCMSACSNLFVSIYTVYAHL